MADSRWREVPRPYKNHAKLRKFIVDKNAFGAFCASLVMTRHPDDQELIVRSFEFYDDNHVEFIFFVKYCHESNLRGAIPSGKTLRK